MKKAYPTIILPRVRGVVPVTSFPMPSATLEAWYKADDGAENSGGNLTGWLDKSGNNRHISITGNAPAFISDAGSEANNKPAVEFDNSNQEYIGGSFPHFPNQCTVFAVYKNTDASARTAGIIDVHNGSNTNTGFNFLYTVSGTSLFRTYDGALRDTSFSDAVPNAAPKLFCGQYQNGQQRHFSARQHKAGIVTPGNFAHTLTTITIGALKTLEASTSFKGRLYELIFYSGYLSPYNRYLVGKYLNTKWSVPVSTLDPTLYGTNVGFFHNPQDGVDGSVIDTSAGRTSILAWGSQVDTMAFNNTGKTNQPDLETVTGINGTVNIARFASGTTQNLGSYSSMYNGNLRDLLNNVSAFTAVAFADPELDNKAGTLFVASNNSSGSSRFEMNTYTSSTVELHARRLDADSESKLIKNVGSNQKTCSHGINYATGVGSIYNNGVLEATNSSFVSTGNTSATTSSVVRMNRALSGAICTMPYYGLALYESLLDDNANFDLDVWNGLNHGFYAA